MGKVSRTESTRSKHCSSPTNTSLNQLRLVYSEFQVVNNSKPNTMSLTLVKSQKESSSKMFQQFHDEAGNIIEVSQCFFKNRISNGKIVRLRYELWTHARGKTCKVITSIRGEKGSRRIFKGKTACRTVLDRFKALPYASVK